MQKQIPPGCIGAGFQPVAAARNAGSTGAGRVNEVQSNLCILHCGRDPASALRTRARPSRHIVECRDVTP